MGQFKSNDCKLDSEENKSICYTGLPVAFQKVAQPDRLNFLKKKASILQHGQTSQIYIWSKIRFQSELMT